MHFGSVPPANARVKIDSLTNTPQPVFAAVSAATGGQTVNGFAINGGAAAEQVIFKSASGAVEYFRVNVAASGWVTRDRPFVIAANLGLSVETATAAGDVEVSVFYWKPGAAGIGA
jgi:hypothetical protein